MKRHFNTYAVLCAALLVCTACGGAKRIDLQGSPALPAATGTVQVEADRNDNTVVGLEVSHLAPPSALTPAKTTYVVWIQPRGSAAENKGQLVVDDDLRGRFQTTTPHRQFDIFVTAEDGVGVSEPQGQEIVRANVTR